MGRNAEGWKIHPDDRTGIYQVRFRHNDKRLERSTGTRNAREARVEAAKIYARHVNGTDERVAKTSGAPLNELMAAWLVAMSAELAKLTVDDYAYTALHIIAPHFKTLDGVTTGSFANYLRGRLGSALAISLRKDVRVMRRFLDWCVEQRHLKVAPQIPAVPKTAIGVRTGPRKAKSTPLTQDEVSRLLMALPERMTLSKLPVRARFVVAWETSLRPSTIGRLRVPEHYRKGSPTLLITDPIDKARFGRELPLTEAARVALDSVCPDEGVIFAERAPATFSPYLKRAAKVAGLDPVRVASLSAYDFRHARIKNLLDNGGALPGVAFLAGHKKVTTTDRYVAVERAAEGARAALALGANTGDMSKTMAKNSTKDEETSSSRWNRKAQKHRQNVAVSGDKRAGSGRIGGHRGVVSGAGLARTTVGLAYLAAMWGSNEATLFALCDGDVESFVGGGPK